MNPTTKFIFEILTVLELIFVEQLVLCLAMKKHCKLGLLIFTDVLITIGIMLITILILSKLPNFGTGGGQFFVLGLFYIFPPLLFSRQSLKDRVIVTFSAFAYGLLIYALSLRIAYLFNVNYLSLLTFCIQTGMHLAIFLTLTMKRNLFKLFNPESIPNKTKNKLMVVIFLSFFLIINLNKNLTVDTAEIQKLLFVVLFAIFFVYSLLLIFELGKEISQNKSLSNQIKEDLLTHMKNRSAFKDDFAELIDKAAPFSLIYMDLNRFKTINDSYGHAVGDRYLICFAEKLKLHERQNTRFYRLSGDEFCCVTDDSESIEAALLEINRLDIFFDNVKFLGFSYGIAHFPDDGEDSARLLQSADSSMYNMKRHSL